MDVNDVVRIRIEEAARRIEATRRRRVAQQAARSRGLAQRHAAKLRNQARAQVPEAPQPSEKREPVTVSFREWLGQSHDPSRVVELPTPFAWFLAVPGSWTTAEELHAELHRSGTDDTTCLYLAAYKDAWLGMTDQWQHDCFDCGADSTSERYMVHDHVWAAASMCPFGFLCVGCIEQRLGRHLAVADFLDVGLNHDPAYRRSDRLMDRLLAESRAA